MSTLVDNSAERAVLAGLCQFGEELFVEIDYIESGHFTHELNQAILLCIKDVIENRQKIENITLMSSAEKLGVFSVISQHSELSFLRSLFTFPVDKNNAIKLAARLAKLKFARDISKTLKNVDSDINGLNGQEGLDEIISMVENPIMGITNSIFDDSENKPVLISEDIEEFVAYLRDNPNEFLGIPTGLNIFDEASGGGIRRKTVVLIGARTGIGKSVIATNAGLNVAKLGIPVLYLDTEMDKSSQQQRLLANLSSIKINDIARGRFGRIQSDLSKVEAAATNLKSLPFYHISIAGKSFDNILGIIKRWVLQKVGTNEDGSRKDCLIIYDYFKLMSSESVSASMQEYQVLGFQITRLSDLCIKYDIPCLSFVQLNRDNEVAQSDRLQWLASTVAKFEAKSPEEIASDGEHNGNRKLSILKARHGEGLQSGDYINIRMQGAIAKLTELNTRNKIKSGNANESQPFEESSDEGEVVFDKKEIKPKNSRTTKNPKN